MSERKCPHCRLWETSAFKDIPCDCGLDEALSLAKGVTP